MITFIVGAQRELLLIASDTSGANAITTELMPQFSNSIPEQSRVMLDEIKRAFGHIQRGGGITLHETSVIDDSGSDAERAQARLMDTDSHWWEVPDHWIENNAGLSFLDDKGFRYYLPAYMSYWIRTGNQPWGLEFHLNQHDRFDRIFSEPEKKMIARFLDFVAYQFDGFGPGETLDEFWRRYFDAPDHP